MAYSVPRISVSDRSPARCQSQAKGIEDLPEGGVGRADAPRIPEIGMQARRTLAWQGLGGLIRTANKWDPGFPIELEEATSAVSGAKRRREREFRSTFAQQTHDGGSLVWSNSWNALLQVRDGLAGSFQAGKEDSELSSSLGVVRIQLEGSAQTKLSLPNSIAGQLDGGPVTPSDACFMLLSASWKRFAASSMRPTSNRCAPRLSLSVVCCRWGRVRQDFSGRLKQIRRFDHRTTDGFR